MSLINLLSPKLKQFTKGRMMRKKEIEWVKRRKQLKYIRKMRQLKRQLDIVKFTTHPQTQTPNPLYYAEVERKVRDGQQKDQGCLCSEYKFCMWIGIPIGQVYICKCAFMDSMTCMHNPCGCLTEFERTRLSSSRFPFRASELNANGPGRARSYFDPRNP